MVLQCSGDDLGSRRRAPVDQDNHRRTFQHIARCGAKGVIGIGSTPPSRHNDALAQKKITDFHSAIEHPARIVTKIQHQPGQWLAGGFLKLFDLTTK